MTARPNFNKLRQAAFDARELASRLFVSDDVTGACHEVRQGGGSCVETEGRRLKGYPKLPDGATLRGYQYHDPERLCNACRAHWFAERAAQALEARVVAERRIAIDEGREHEVTLDADRLCRIVDGSTAAQMGPLAEVLIDPDKHGPEVRGRARRVVDALIKQHSDKRDAHANVVAFLTDVVRR